MSVTTVLVPVDEAEAEALLSGEADVQTIVARTARLRARVARVDPVREPLHDLLFRTWDIARQGRPSLLARVRGLIQKPKSWSVPSGYDPFVHLWGRSLPVTGAHGGEVAEALQQVLAADDGAFTAKLGEHLASLDPQAASVWAEAPRTVAVEGVEAAVRGQAKEVASAAAERRWTAALDALARLNAWSRPVWRLDGEMLPDVVSALGLRVMPGRATALFEGLGLDEAAIESLPKRLASFHGAGTYLSSGEVKMLAGSLRLSRGRVAKNAAESGGAPELALRHLRLVDEAVRYCEAEHLGLIEASGVEWHEHVRGA